MGRQEESPKPHPSSPLLGVEFRDGRPARILSLRTVLPGGVTVAPAPSAWSGADRERLNASIRDLRTNRWATVAGGGASGGGGGKGQALFHPQAAPAPRPSPNTLS